MSIVYGQYNIDLTNKEYALLLQNFRTKARKSILTSMGGAKVYTLPEYKSSSVIGFNLIGDETRQTIIGAGFRGVDLSRVWVTATGVDKHTMFIDGVADIVTNLGFLYDSKSKAIMCPANDKKIIVTL